MTVPTAREKHQHRMWERGIARLQNDLGYPPAQAADIIGALRAEGTDFCVLCSYKKKGTTGSGSQDVLDPIYLDEINEVIRNRQRDGDSGSLVIRENNVVTVLRRFVHAANGLTDEELEPNGDLKDSLRACRAALVPAGYLKMTGEKRLSRHNRPMTVWGLTDAALEYLMEKM